MAIDIRANYIRYDGLGRPFGAEGILKAMQKYDIEKAVLVPDMAVDADFRLGNKELFDVIKEHDNLYGYLVVNPNYPKESIQMMRTAMMSRKFVALALFRGASRPYPNIEDYREILNAHRRFGKPVFVEVRDADAAAAAEQMALEFSTVKFVLGCMGGSDWKRLMTCGKILNLFLETSGSFDAEKIEEAVSSISPHRLLFGSNMPFTDPAEMLALIRSSNISDANMERILGTNARKLFVFDSQPE